MTGCPPLLFKDLVARSRSAPGFVIDPWREVELYQRHLAGPDAPACAGTVAGHERAWLFLERLDAIPLWQAAGDEPWLAAARWLARRHSAPPPASAGRLLVRDRAHLERWVSAPWPPIRPGAGRDQDCRAGGDRGPDRVAGDPAARRVLSVQRARPRFTRGAGADPGDRLGMAGFGPGLLDLAALIAGKHEPDLRRRIVEAYRAELAEVPAEFAETLRAARLLVALKWIGWEPDWMRPTSTPMTGMAMP